MLKNSIQTVSGHVEEARKNEVDLDEALSVAGFGKYNMTFSLILTMFLIAVIIEPVGYSFVLPAAKCDLNMTDSQRGFVASIPYIGIVLTAFPWGYLVDTRGRKKMIIYSSLGAGTFSILSGFMPEYITFALCKFLSSLCISCSATVPYSYIGEILPPKQRDFMFSFTNAMQLTGSLLVPLLAWGILPLDFRLNFGLYYFRSWRLLSVIYANFFILNALLLSFGPESPKYLISQGLHDESLEVLKRIYAGNKGKSPDQYPIKFLKIPAGSNTEKVPFLQSLQQQSVPLLKPPYLKWLILNSTLFFGMFAIVNGLSVWLPDILNRVLTANIEGITACRIIKQRLNETSKLDLCDDVIDLKVFGIRAASSFCCSIIGLAISATVKLVGKKTLLILIFLIMGSFLIVINFITQLVLFTIFISAIPVVGLVIGPINAYAGEIFPTKFRGMAIGLTMMLGRLGSVVGTSVAGVLLSEFCEFTFYGYGGVLLMCALLSCLLPQAKPRSESTEMITHL